MSKRDKKAMMTAVVSTGVFLSLVSQAFAETANPAKVMHTSYAEVTTASPAVRNTIGEPTATESNDTMHADEQAKETGNESVQQEIEEFTATNGLITVTLGEIPDEPLSLKDLRFTQSVNGSRSQRLRTGSFLWLPEERKALITYSPIRAAKDEKNVTIAMQYHKETTTQTFKIAGKGAAVDHVEIIALAEDAKLYTDKRNDKSLKLIAVAYDDLDRVVTGNISWQTADKKVATVDSFGTVKAKGTGVTKIIAKVGNVEAEFEVAVNQADFPGTQPELSVQKATIEEAQANDGSITSKQTIKLKNGTFRDDISEEDVKAKNLPEGLGITVERESKDELTVSFTGKAKKHAQTDNRDDVAFTVDRRKIKGAKADVTTDSFSIRFKDPVIVTPPVIDPVPQPDYLAIAREAVAALFTDNTKTALQPGVTQGTIDTARNKVERLSNSVPEKANLLKDIQTAIGLLNGTRILPKENAAIYLPLGADNTYSNVVLIGDVFRPMDLNEHKISEFVEVYKDNEPGSFLFDPRMERFNVKVSGQDAGFIDIGYDTSKLSVTKMIETNEPVITALPGAMEGDRSYLLFRYSDGQSTIREARIPVYFDAVPQLLTNVEQVGNSFVLHANEPVNGIDSGKPNSESRLFGSIEIALNGEFEDETPGNLIDASDNATVNMAGQDITVTFPREFIQQFEPKLNANTKVRFTTAKLSDLRGNRFNPEFKSVTVKWKMESDDTKLLEEARQAVEALFTDSDKVMLMPGVTEAIIEAAKSKVDAVSDSVMEKAELLDYIQKAKHLLYGPRILRKEDARIHLAIDTDDNPFARNFFLLDDQAELSQSNKHRMSEYVEVYTNNKPGSFVYDPASDHFNVMVDGTAAGYVSYGYDQATLSVTKDTDGIEIYALPDASEGDTSYLTFTYTHGEDTSDQVEIPVILDGTHPQLLPTVTQNGDEFTLYANELLDDYKSGMTNDKSHLFGSIEIALNGNFDDDTSGNVKDFAEAVTVTVSGREITVKMRSDFIDQLGQEPTSDTKIRFTTMALHDLAGNSFDPAFNTVTADWKLVSPD